MEDGFGAGSSSHGSSPLTTHYSRPHEINICMLIIQVLMNTIDTVPVSRRISAKPGILRTM